VVIIVSKLCAQCSVSFLVPAEFKWNDVNVAKHRENSFVISFRHLLADGRWQKKVNIPLPFKLLLLMLFQAAVLILCYAKTIPHSTEYHEGGLFAIS
jgi:hypothetical protein